MNVAAATPTPASTAKRRPAAAAFPFAVLVIGVRSSPPPRAKRRTDAPHLAP
jgi:hypothetical protein